MSELQIIPYSSKWSEKHTAFAIIYFKGRRKRINPDYIFWKFRGEEQDKTPSFLLAIQDDNVIGQLGLVPCEIRTSQQTYECHWACDLMVDPNFRGGGVAKHLYEKAIQMKATLGSDPSPAAAISMKKFGFKDIEGPSKLFFPIYLSSISDKKFKSLSAVLKHVYNPAVLWLMLKKGLSFNKQLENRIEIEQIDFDWIYSMRNKKYAYVQHDKDFYEWRMSSFKDYQKAGEFYQKKGSYFYSIRTSNTTAFICDFVCNDISTAKILIQNIVLEMSSRKLQELKFLTLDEDLITALKGIGFLKYRSKTDVIYMSKDDSFTSEMANFEKFAYTYLDSDENI